MICVAAHEPLVKNRRGPCKFETHQSKRQCVVRVVESMCAAARVADESLPIYFLPASAQDAAERCEAMTGLNVQTPQRLHVTTAPAALHSTGLRSVLIALWP